MLTSDPPARPDFLENRIEDLLKLKSQLEEDVLQLQSAVRMWTEVATLKQCPAGAGRCPMRDRPCESAGGGGTDPGCAR